MRSQFFICNIVRSIRALVVICLVMAPVFSSPAQTHTHGDDVGVVTWYPRECCHNGDCRPVANILPAPSGLWMTTVDGYTILVGSADERRPSRDMRWHICINTDFDHQTPTARCIFEPPAS